MSNTKTVLGPDMALVNLKGGGTALVPRGSDVPDVDAAETKRLKDLGVFDAPKATSTATAAPSVDPRVEELEKALAAAQADKEAAEKALSEASKNPHS